MARAFNIDDVEITVTPESEDISPDGQFETGDGEADLEIINAIKEASEWSEWAGGRGASGDQGPGEVLP